MVAASYVLTLTARQNLREAKVWSMARWGAELTSEYFYDLHKSALYIAEHHHQYNRQKTLTAESGLCVYPVREHYIVYEPLTKKKIAIVAFIRQGRDIHAILSRNASLFRQELNKIRKK